MIIYSTDFKFYGNSNIPVNFENYLSVVNHGEWDRTFPEFSFLFVCLFENRQKPDFTYWDINIRTYDREFTNDYETKIKSMVKIL